MEAQNSPPAIVKGIQGEDSRRLLWRVIREILFNTPHLDLHLSGDLSTLIWSTFENFHEYYRRLLDEKGLEEVLPAHLLARPLIGFKKEHDERSPLFSSHRGATYLQFINNHVHVFRMYVGLSNRLNAVTKGHEGAISRRFLKSPDPQNFCYVFRRKEGSNVSIRNDEGILIKSLDKQERFTREIEEKGIQWPSVNVADLRDLPDTNNNYEALYNSACKDLEGRVFDLLEGDDKSEALVAWWLYQAQADFVLFRGFDEGKKIDPKYTWGGVWFLFNTDVVGDHLRALSLLVHECFNIAAIEIRARESSREKERANIGAGMFHNLAHYVLPLSVYGRSIGRYVEEGDEEAVRALANNIEDTVNRLSRFVAAVQIYVKQRDAYLHPKIESLENVPGEALLIHTRALYTSLCWFGSDVGAGIGRKYLTILCNLYADDKELDPDNFDDLEELQKRVKPLVKAVPPSTPDFNLLSHWWKHHFGINIDLEGNFKTLNGHQALVSGVVEEFLLNSLCASSTVLAKLRLRGDEKNVIQKRHISIEAAVVQNRKPVIILKNWSVEPLDEKVFDEPEQDKGWGIFGNRLLMKRAGGDIRILDDGKVQKQGGEWPLWVGFEIMLMR